MTEGEVLAVEQRLQIWRAGLNALGSDALSVDRQHAVDQGKLIAEVFRLKKELIKACEPVDRAGEIQ